MSASLVAVRPFPTGQTQPNISVQTALSQSCHDSSSLCLDVSCIYFRTSPPLYSGRNIISVFSSDLPSESSDLSKRLTSRTSRRSPKAPRLLTLTSCTSHARMPSPRLARRIAPLLLHIQALDPNLRPSLSGSYLESVIEHMTDE